MHSRISVVVLASALAACNYTPKDLPDRGIAPVNVPVVERADYALDLAAPGGALLAAEQQRLEGWFRTLRVGYGDVIYVDGGYSDTARVQIGEVAARYGMLVEPGAPLTAGALPQGAVRVIVSRARATVPNCPNWSVPAQPNYNNRSMSNFACAVNSNLAAMVANPEDLIHGREGSGVVDPRTGAKALDAYREGKPTGADGLEKVSSKGQ
jgi:pilus assembly protein CpaD